VGDSGLCASDLCVDAAQRLLKSLEWSTDSVDCLVFVTQTPDYLLPATSCIIQDRLGLKPNCYALDISLGCSGWVYGLSVVAALMESGVFKRALLLAGDTTSVTKSPQDRSTFPLFGDAGTATAIEYRENSGTMAFDFGTDGSGYEAIMIKDGGFANTSGLSYFDYGTTTRVSGTALDGIYQQVITPNGNTLPGSYSIWISARDIYGNKTMTPTEVVFQTP
jgi:3-oxoacyl-[acyl-carrier-protein] synthase-3